MNTLHGGDEFRDVDIAGVGGGAVGWYPLVQNVRSPRKENLSNRPSCDANSCSHALDKPSPGGRLRILEVVMLAQRHGRGLSFGRAAHV